MSRPYGDDMSDIDINAMICGIFISATAKAAVHLGQDYQENLRTTKNTDFEKVKELFDISQKLILNQNDEIFGISTIEWNTVPWMRTLSNAKVRFYFVKLSKAKVRFYFDSVLYLGKIHENPRSMETWKQKIEWFTKRYQKS